jgi:hypothetical protein
MLYPDSSNTFTLQAMIEGIFSIRGLLRAFLILLMVLLVFFVAFYQPARKGLLSKTKLLALLAVSVFNLAIVLPFAINFTESLTGYLLGLWWLISWPLFVLANFFFLVLTMGFIFFGKWESLPMVEERPLRSILFRSVAFEILYAMACPFIVVLSSVVIGAIPE